MCVKDVLSQPRDNLMNKREVPCKGEYTVTVTSLGANYSNKKMLKVEWRSRTRRGCTLVVMPEALEDVQWLVNPFDVDFALSLRGDLRPIERSIACAGGDAGEARGDAGGNIGEAGGNIGAAGGNIGDAGETEWERVGWG